METEKEIRSFLEQLKREEIGFYGVPEELRTNKAIVDLERKLGLRKSTKRGYDVIRNSFFVEEIVTYNCGERTENICTFFPDFRSYYLFLNGDIYENSCYYQFDISKVEMQIDLEKMSNKAFEKRVISDYTLELSQEELDKYAQAEQVKKMCKNWISKFNSCNTCEKFVANIKRYQKSKIANIVDVDFFIYQYVFENIHDENRFRVIMEYLSLFPSDHITYSLCLIYDPQKVLDAYSYSNGSKHSAAKHKKMLRGFTETLDSTGLEKIYKYCNFDSNTHYYCENLFWNQSIIAHRYFESFEEFITYRKGDLTNCNLSKVIGLDLDISSYMTDSTTIFPIDSIKQITYTKKKLYKNEKFFVFQEWQDSNQNIIKKYDHEFDYFFDFVFFLSGDLSDADLLLCDGLENIRDATGLNLSGAMLTSTVCEKIGIKYENYKIDTKLIRDFSLSYKNEEETMLAFQDNRELSLSFEEERENMRFKQEVYYISDIHLMHRIQNAKCKSKNDIYYTILNIVNTIVSGISYDSTLLIGGDVASSFTIFQLFVKFLRNALDEKRFDTKVIFVLGNHELWEFPEENLLYIIEKYRNTLNCYNMYLLQNDLLYIDDSDAHRKCILKTITNKELAACDKSTLRLKLSASKLVIFGGLAFSGYNKEFNANNGIYRLTIDREIEMEETQKFESLYYKVSQMLSDKNLIILTHTPKKDWCKNPEPERNFVYVNGHTHYNYFHDDGEYRIYADNQIGYHRENPHVKHFYIGKTYDLFSDFDDGIFEITKQQYTDFYRGKNIRMNFSKTPWKLYMLKKNGYYCFIYRSYGGLSILNGGSLKKLPYGNIQYYYDNMDRIIDYLEEPFRKFTGYQKKISNEIQKIGGSGTIHGCIIDIDHFNHVYINPVDMKVTGYWALDMRYKIAYPSVSALLQEQCPKLYNSYQRLLSEKENLMLIDNSQDDDLMMQSEIYLNTDIYRASRIMNKLQKLNHRILTIWEESFNDKNMLPEGTRH